MWTQLGLNDDDLRMMSKTHAVSKRPCAVDNEVALSSQNLLPVVLAIPDAPNVHLLHVVVPPPVYYFIYEGVASALHIVLHHNIRPHCTTDTYILQVAIFVTQIDDIMNALLLVVMANQPCCGIPAIIFMLLCFLCGEGRPRSSFRY